MMPIRTTQRILTIICASTLLASTAALAQKTDYAIRALPRTTVKIRDGIWSRRMEINHDITIPSCFKKCEQTGRIDNFAKAGDLMKGEFQGRRYDDSDVFKVMEGACYALAARADSELEKYLDGLIEKIAAAQESDGYLFTCRTIASDNVPEHAGKTRWSYLAHSHELYNVGHLYEAATAHFLATGKRTLLNVALKNADLIDREFGPGPKQRKDVPGHQEIEIGLVKLYRATGNKKYLKLAKHFLDQRGKSGPRKLYGAYSQDHRPVVLQKEAVGHAVRALYLYSAMTDIAALTGDRDYLTATSRLWEDIVFKKMYVTGGVGSSRSGEAFGPAYELPNETAYNETCAAIGFALFNHRMFLLHGESKYIDILERLIYNGFLAGVSLEGDRFFYPNPLACDGRTKFNQGSVGRSPWFSCSCCPVNIARFVPSVSEYIYARRDDDIYVNLFLDSTVSTNLKSTKVSLDLKTRYPRDGEIKISFQVDRPTDFTMRLRVPGWSQGRPMPGKLYEYQEKVEKSFAIQVNGKPVTAHMEAGFVVLQRCWESGDVIHLSLPMPIRRVRAHRLVKADQARVALERGPIVYCIEAVDHGGRVRDIYLPGDVRLEETFAPDLLGGVTVLKGLAKRVVRQEDQKLVSRSTQIVAVPYYAWAHREIGEMAVWIPNRQESAIPSGGQKLQKKTGGRANQGHE